MSQKYYVCHRRGTAEQWASTDVKPLAGELVIEIDNINNLHKLKIGDGEHSYADLAYLTAGDDVVSQVLPRTVTVTLELEKWAEVTSPINPNVGHYGQVVDIDGITQYSRLDLQPDTTMLAELKSLNLVFITENKDGVLTVYSVGDMPLKTYTMQATILETQILVDCDKILGTPVGTLTENPDWTEENEKSAAYIKNKPIFGSMASKDEIGLTDLSEDVQEMIKQGGGGSVEGLGALAYKDSLSKEEVGLGNVDNTADADKPISTATQEALDLKTDKSEFTAYQTSNDAAVKANTDAIGVLNGNSSTDGSVDKKIADAIAAEDLAQYAKQTSVNALETRVEVLEDGASNIIAHFDTMSEGTHEDGHSIYMVSKDRPIISLGYSNGDRVRLAYKVGEADIQTIDLFIDGVSDGLPTLVWSLDPEEWFTSWIPVYGTDLDDGVLILFVELYKEKDGAYDINGATISLLSTGKYVYPNEFPQVELISVEPLYVNQSYLDNLVVPTKTSELENDSGFLNAIPNATRETLGGVKVGYGLHIDESEGTINSSPITYIDGLLNDANVDAIDEQGILVHIEEIEVTQEGADEQQTYTYPTVDYKLPIVAGDGISIGINDSNKAQINFNGMNLYEYYEPSETWATSVDENGVLVEYRKVEQDWDGQVTYGGSEMILPVVAGDGVRIDINDNGKAEISIDATPGQTNPSLVETTYAELKALRDQGQLVPGTQYRITDYTTVTSQPDTLAASHKFDIIVTADSPSTLNENARVCKNANDVYFASLTWKPGLTIDDVQVLYSMFMDESTYDSPHESSMVVTELTTCLNQDGELVPALVNPAPDEDDNICLYVYMGTATVGYTNTLVSIQYTLSEDDEVIYEGQYHPNDVFVELDYVDDTPVLYKTDPVTSDMPSIDDTDYEDEFVYIGDYELDGIVYNRWAKYQSGERYNHDVLTNRVVVNGRFTITQKDLKSHTVGNVFDKWQEYYPNRSNPWGDEPHYHLTNRIVISDAAKLSAWKIKYCLDNDSTRFKWAHSDGTGVIYEMIDEFDNVAPYDFKNIKFKRYRITECAGCPDLVDKYAGLPGHTIYSIDEADFIWVYTFTWIDANGVVNDASVVGQYLTNEDGLAAGVVGNHINTYRTFDENLTISELNNIVFQSSAKLYNGDFFGIKGNIFGLNCNNNTFLDDSSDNIFASQCSGNILLGVAENNNFDQYCCWNIFSGGLNFNSIGMHCLGNIVNGTCCDSIIEHDVSSVILAPATLNGSRLIRIKLCSGIHGKTISAPTNSSVPIVYKPAGSREIILD